MKFVLWIVGLFALAVLVGLAATVNTGYAILFVPPYRMEVSFNLLIVGVVVLIVLAHLVLRFIAVAAKLPAEVRDYQRRKKLRSARHALREAAIAFFEGRYQRAEREALKAVDDEYAPENRALALMIAARAAGQVHDFTRRDQYLSRLEALPERLQLARHMLEAELYLEAKSPLEALAAVERARAISPNLTAALRLELKIRLLLKQPEAVLQLTEKLLKAEALEPQQARRYRQAAYSQQLASIASYDEMRQWLRRMPEVERRNPLLIGEAVSRLAALGEHDHAATLLAGLLADEELATPELEKSLGRLAPQLSAETRLKLLAEGEGWLKQRPRDHMLLLALGQLALAQQLWGKAQSYLEASLSVEPSLIAHSELVRLFYATDKNDRAEEHYRQSLELALKLGH